MLLIKKTRDLIKSTFLQCNIIDVGDIINTTHRMKEMSFAVRKHLEPVFQRYLNYGCYVKNVVVNTVLLALKIE